MIQSVLQTLTRTPRSEPEDSDYDVLAEASISQHIVSRRNGNASLPSTPSRPYTEKASVSHSTRRRPAPRQQAEVDGDELEELEELIDVKQAVEALERLRSLLQEPSAVEGTRFMDVYACHTQQLVSAMRMNAEEQTEQAEVKSRGGFDEMSAMLSRKNRGEVILGIIIVSIRIIRLVVEITTPWLRSLQLVLLRITENETVQLIVEKLAELVLVALTVTLNILKMVQRWTRQ